MPVLIISMTDDVQIVELPEGKLVYLGRTDDCDICITSPTVSRRHAVFLNQNGYCGIKDLDSNNGTLLNDKPLNHSVLLRDGDVIKISRYIIKYKSTLAAAREGGGITRIRERPPIAPASSANGSTSNTRAALPRAMTSANLIEEMLARIAPEPRRENEEDTRILQDDSTRQRSATGSAIVPGQSGRIGPRVSSGTAIIVKNGLTSTSGRAPLPHVSPPPEVEAERVEKHTPATPGVFTMKEGGLSTAPEPTDTRDDGEETPKSHATEVVEVVGDYMRPPSARRNSRMVIRYADEDDATVVRRRPDGESSPEDRRTMEDDDTRTLAKRADSVVMYARPPSDADEDVEAPPTPEDEGREVHNERRRLSGQDALPLGKEFREAIEARLQVYEELDKLSGMRRVMRKKNPNLPPDVVEELDRQEEERQRPPLQRQVRRMMAARAAKAEERNEAVKAAGKLAMQQWQILADSDSKALPEVISRAHEITLREPLRVELEKARIDATNLLGGATYYLALEKLRDEAEHERAWQRHATQDDKQQKGERQGNTVIKMLYSMLSLADGLPEGEDADKTRKHDLALTKRIGRINRELAFIERNLVQEFRAVYSAVAAHFVPMLEKMPVSVRAFLRYGAISFKAWWMDSDVHNRIVFDCSGKVKESFDDEAMAPGGAVLYADEYLQFVMKGECSPAPGEQFGGLDGDAVALKGFDLYREVIDGDVRVKMLQRLSERLEERRLTVRHEVAELSRAIAVMERESALKRGELLKLRRELHVLRESDDGLEQSSRLVRDKLLPETRDRVVAAEESLSTGECAIPAPDMLVRRECDILSWVRAEVSDGDERFMPLVLRDRFVVKADVAVDRLAAIQELEQAEKEDPWVFSEALGNSSGRMGEAALRLMPVTILAPMFATRAEVYQARMGMERGRVFVPVCLGLSGIRGRVFAEAAFTFARWSRDLSVQVSRSTRDMR